MPTPKNSLPNQSTAGSDMAGELIRIWGQLSADRSMFETQWQEVSDLVSPNQSHSFRGEWINPGEKRNLRQYDNTAGIALDRFVAILDSLLTPNGQTWHTLKTDNPILNKDKATVEYLETVNRILFNLRYSSTANFVESNQSVWESIGAYGTGFQYVDALWGTKALRYKFIPLGNMYVTEDHQGRMDGFWRKYRYSAHQAVIEFGDKLPSSIIEAAKNNPTQRFDFLHVVRKRVDFDPSRLDFMGKPWAAYDICIEGQTMMKEEGFISSPYIGTRYALSLEEVYGRSPAMRVLPTIKTLNEAKKAMITQSHRAMNPLYLVHDDGVLSNFGARPGAIVAGGLDYQGRELVKQLHPGNIQLGKENMDDDRGDIKSAFMTDLFQILMETPEMTATEVMERVKEKGILISPSVSRQEQYLGDMIEREIDLARHLRLLPPMSKMMLQAGGEYNIRFESPLAKMRRAEESAGFMRMLEQGLQIAQATQDPSVMYFFNLEVAIPAMAEIGGVPAKWMNSIEKVQALKQAQKQSQETQQLIDAGPGAAQVLKALPQGAGGAA